MSTVEVIVATVGRPHGLAGEVTVLSRTDEPERRFAPGAHITTERGRNLTVRQHRWHNGTLLLSFTDVTDRTAAEQLRGEVLVARVPGDEHLPAADEYFDRQLVGLAAVTAAGEHIGVVTAVHHLPAQDLLVIETESGERLVPFVADLVPAVDLGAGTCTIAPIPGLLDDAETQ